MSAADGRKRGKYLFTMGATFGSSRSGHVMAFVKTSKTGTFFDPNFGQFTVPVKDLGTAMAALFAEKYSGKHNFATGKSSRWRIIRVRVEDESLLKKAKITPPQE